MAKYLDETGLAHFWEAVAKNDAEIKTSFNVKYPMPTVDVGSEMQCRVSNDAYSVQSGCEVGGKLYLFFANSSNSLKMIELDRDNGTSVETSLGVVGHANTATATGNGTIILSSNGDSNLYEVSTSGALVSTHTAPCTDCCVTYDGANDRFIGTARSTNKIYFFDNSLTIDSTVDFDWSFVSSGSGNVAMQNCSFCDGILYATFRPNSVYALNVETLQFADMFRVAFSPSSEFEGIVFFDGKYYSMCHAYTERVTTINPIYIGDYLPYNGYNGELTFVNDSHINSLWQTIDMYVDYNATSVKCYGTSTYPFMSLTQAFERAYNYENVVIHLAGDPSHDIKLAIGGTSITINAADAQNKPTMPRLTVSGNGALTLENLIIGASSGNALTFSDKSNINAHIASCEINAPNGTGISVNWGCTVEVRDTTTIDAQVAIAGVNASVSVSPASIVSGAINSYRNSHIGNKQELLHNNTSDSFTTKIPITAFNVVVGQIKTKVNTYNFYVPYVGVVVGNSLYVFGSRYAGVVGDAVTATVEGGITNNGTTFTKSAGTADAVIYTMYGIL